jgi:long-subunit acyl-CoA synthetase (AMP-forming)
MSEVNAALSPHEKLEFAVVVKEPWTTDNGFLTPTMKIKRNVIEERYEPQVERWFEAHQRVIWEDDVGAG